MATNFLGRNYPAGYQPTLHKRPYGSAAIPMQRPEDIYRNGLDLRSIQAGGPSSYMPVNYSVNRTAARPGMSPINEPIGVKPPQSSGADALNADAVNRWYDEYSAAYQAKYGIAPPHNRDVNMEGAPSGQRYLRPELYPQQPQIAQTPDKNALINRWTAVNEPAGIANIDRQITDNARMAAYAQSQRAAQSINAVTNESTPPELKSTMDAIMARYASLGRYGTSEMYTELEAARRQYEMSRVSSIAGQYSYFNR